MASEVSRLIDDELQKEGRDETARLLPGHGVKVSAVPFPAYARDPPTLSRSIPMQASCIWT